MSLNKNNLPVEMIEMILVAAGDENHRVMAAVCRQWRAIILAYRARNGMVSLGTEAVERFLERYNLKLTDTEWVSVILPLLCHSVRVGFCFELTFKLYIWYV